VWQTILPHALTEMTDGEVREMARHICFQYAITPVQVDYWLRVIFAVNCIKMGAFVAMCLYVNG
jgi:hypothetical protein